MTQSLAKYHARAPRYILNTDDDFLIRVAGPRQVPWEEGTEIRNVSLTGLAFTAPDDLCPILGEVIKIQFTVPGNRQMACHAVVTRLDADSDNAQVILVGVHFYKLEMAHRIVLAQGISKKFKFHHAKKPEDLEQDPTNLLHFFPQIFMMGTLLYLWLACMYGMIAWGATGWIEGLTYFFNSLS
jgi:hypothetical protein